MQSKQLGVMAAAGLCAAVHAQQFQRVIGTEGDERFNGLAATRDGGTIGAGFRTGPGGFGLEDVYVVKHDALGQVQWDLFWGGPGREKAYAVEQTLDGGYIVACETNGAQPGFEIGLLRLDPVGNVVWARVYPGTFEADPVLTPNPGVDVDELPDGSFVVTGRSAGRPVLFRTTPAGAIIFHATYFVPGPNEPARATFTEVELSQHEGMLVMSGAFHRGVAGASTEGLLMKTTMAGVPVLTRIYMTNTAAGAPTVEEGADGIEVLRDGSYALVGRTDVGTPGDAHVQAWRTDPVGNVLWNRVYLGAAGPGTGVHFESAYRAIEQNDREQISIGGRFFPGQGMPGPSRAFLHVIDMAGAPVMTWAYLAGDRQWAEDAVPMRSCGWALAGLITGAPVGVAGIDGYLVKTRDDGSSGCVEERAQPPVVQPQMASTFIELLPIFRQEHLTWPGQFVRADSRDPAVCVEACCGVCPADLSGSSDPNDPGYGKPDCQVDSSDFFYFLDQFGAGNLAVADISGSSDPNDPAYGVPDGLIDASDFFYYLDLFVRGCS